MPTKNIAMGPFTRALFRQREALVLACLLILGFLYLSQLYNSNIIPVSDGDSWSMLRLNAPGAHIKASLATPQDMSLDGAENMGPSLALGDTPKPLGEDTSAPIHLTAQEQLDDPPQEINPGAADLNDDLAISDSTLTSVVDESHGSEEEARLDENAGSDTNQKTRANWTNLSTSLSPEQVALTKEKLGALLDIGLRPPDEYKTNVQYPYPRTDPNKRANAVALVLTRNEDADELVNVLASYEERFNHRYNYPYLFLNDEPFSEFFKQTVSRVISGNATYVKIPPELWETPDWIDRGKYQEALREMELKKVFHGNVASYHQMCRFFSGPMFQLEEVQQYDYYWRIDSTKVRFHCNMTFDPFVFMQERGLAYGFNIAVHELMDTVPSLWNVTLRFIAERPDLVKGSWLNFFTEDGSEYNGHHFWSNFEIGSVKFFRSAAYQAFFDFLDRDGGFFYERWGDAPVHSLALGLFVDYSQVHFFNEVGYTHDDMTHCPTQAAMLSMCDCHTYPNIDPGKLSALYQFLNLVPKTLMELEDDLQKAADQLTMLHEESDVHCPGDAPIQIEENGQWRLCEVPIQGHPCLVYSFTVKNGATSLELEKTLARNGCVIHYFNQWGRENEINAALRMLDDPFKDAVKWHQISLGSRDGFNGRRPDTQKLFINERRFSTLRKELGHANLTVDVLKFDLEGDEWTVLADLLYHDSLSRVNYVMFESHYSPEDLWSFGSALPAMLSTLMANAGFELVALSQNPHGKEVILFDLAIPCCYKWVFRNTNQS